MKRYTDAGLVKLHKPFARVTSSIHLIAETGGAEPQTVGFSQAAPQRI
ncbi:hypothetical protein PCAR4_350007 [Paraburkholderia caribensis]|nr:hypothetical protein PCAR4_350007 [Paraburkholderia caribensis]